MLPFEFLFCENQSLKESKTVKASFIGDEFINPKGSQFHINVCLGFVSWIFH